VAESGKQGKWVFRNERWYFVPGTAGAFDPAPHQDGDIPALTSLADVELLLAPLRTSVQLFGLPVVVVFFADHLRGPVGAAVGDHEYSQWFEPPWWARLRAVSAEAAGVGEEMKTAALDVSKGEPGGRHESVFGSGTILVEPLGFQAEGRRLLFGSVAVLEVSKEKMADASDFPTRFALDRASSAVLSQVLQAYLKPRTETERYRGLIQTLISGYLARASEAYVSRLELTAERARSRHFLLRAENLERQLLRGTAEVERAGRGGGVMTSELSAILESPFIGVTIEDADYRVRYLNPMLRRNFGNVVGRKCYEAFKGRNSPCEPCPIDLIWEQGQGSTRYTTSDPRTGNSFEVLSVPLVGDAGEKMVVEVGIEVTALVKQREDLEKSISGLRLRNQQLSLMLEQLNAVLLNTSREMGDLLIESSLFAPRFAESSDPGTIEIGSERLGQISETIDALARAASGAGEVSLALATVGRPTPVDVPQLANELAVRISDGQDGEAVTLRVAVMPSILCDRNAVSGALLGLMRWVVTSRGGDGPAKLDISHTMSAEVDSVSQGDSYHIVSVGPHNPARGFADSPATVEEVSGLPESVDETMDVNLIIASLLAKRMGGALWLHARAGTDVTFYLSIPAAPMS